MIRELQHYASALIFTEPHLPWILLSQDVQTLSINGKSLSLATWRAGLKKLYSDIEARIMKVLKGSIIPFHVPDDLEDDMTVLTRDYSWLHGRRFTEEPNPLL